jgi:hypothetical protein
MDQAQDLGKLAQYGAVGIVAFATLTIIVLIFRQLINHVLKQNDRNQERQEVHQAKTVESLHAIGQAIRDLDNTIRRFQIDVRRDVAEMVHSEVTAAGSRAHRTRPRDG